jgi:hypothetical protein
MVGDNLGDATSLLVEQFGVDTPEKLYSCLLRFRAFDDDMEELTGALRLVSCILKAFFDEFHGDLMTDYAYADRFFRFLKAHELSVKVSDGKLDFSSLPSVTERHKRTHAAKWATRLTTVHTHVTRRIRRWWDPHAYTLGRTHPCSGGGE